MVLRVENVVHPKRIKCLTNKVNLPRNTGKCVVYWMSRDQRSQDNFALQYAHQLAASQELPLVVVFNLVPKFLDATIRHFGFMLKGLQEVEEELQRKQIPFHLLRGSAIETVPSFADNRECAAVVTDMSPLRFPREWYEGVARQLEKRKIPMYQVDAHNIVPVWEASDKQEVAARTIRSKIECRLPEYLTEFPDLAGNVLPKQQQLLPLVANAESTDWKAALASLQVDQTVQEIANIVPGYRAAKQVLQEFCEQRLALYGSKRNDPNVNVASGLSPYFHFGQLSVQHAILHVKNYARLHPSCAESAKSFIEEAVVRRELADNYCYYNVNYDKLTGAAGWAKDTLEVHQRDARAYVYTLEQFEQSKTHDALWNGAQKQLVEEGKMHGFLRMYWAKKILEWTATPQQALEIAIYLNDRYSIDGRDPNGYVGVMWSICGIHDMGWTERPIFGKIRFMNYDGCKRKFDVAQFERKYSSNSTQGVATMFAKVKREAESQNKSKKQRK